MKIKVRQLWVAKLGKKGCMSGSSNELRVFAARSRRRSSVGRTRGVGEWVGLWRFHPGRSLSGPMIAGHEARPERHDARITVGKPPSLHGRRRHLGQGSGYWFV